MTKRRPLPDKHLLYQASVQNTEVEIAFLRRVFRRHGGRLPRRLREDFCGTALLASDWVRRIRDAEAVGVDLDRRTLDWGRERNVSGLGSRAARVRLLRQDVRECTETADIVVAFNFSWFVFKSRDILLDYFRSVRSSLTAGGVFVLDIYGGSEAQEIREERTAHDGFTYVWEQERYNPITGDYRCHIHFDLPGGRRMERAFTYDWRLWGLPEAVEVLRDAGFRGVDVYWEGSDRRTGGGNGVFRRSRVGDDSVSWVAYIVATVAGDGAGS